MPITTKCNGIPTIIIEKLNGNRMQFKIYQQNNAIGQMEITTGKQCYINDLRIDTARRNEGIGSCIYSVIERTYLAKCNGIRLNAESQDAMNFWQKHGFSFDYYDENDMSYAMSKGNT